MLLVSNIKISNFVQKLGKIKSFFNSQKAAPYFFVLPFITFFSIFFLYPIISSVIISFQKILGPGDVEFIGFKNYLNLFNSHFLNAIIVSIRYAFWTILVLIPLPIFLAVLVNSKITIGKNFFRSALFIPALTSVVVAGLFFRLAFGEQTSTLVNFIIGKFGFHPIIWLQGKHTSMFVLVLLSTWRWLGVNTIYFLSGLQGIPPELYEAASIDGANELQKFRSITLPGLKPIINFVFIISLYAGLAMFEESFILWPGQRSPNEIGLTIVGYIYQQGFGRNNMGYGSAIGITLFLVLIVINIFTLSLMGIFKKESD